MPRKAQTPREPTLPSRAPTTLHPSRQGWTAHKDSGQPAMAGCGHVTTPPWRPFSPDSSQSKHPLYGQTRHVDLNKTTIRHRREDKEEQMAFNGDPRPQAPYGQYAQQPMPTMQGGEPYGMGAPMP